jgi:dolichyl-phosphate beta-glucosyltransferase
MRARASREGSTTAFPAEGPRDKHAAIMRVTYVVPVHNETRVLWAKVSALATGLDARGGGEILLVENGSRDDSWALCQEIEREYTGKSGSNGMAVRAYTVANAGIGHAYDRGLRAMLSLHDAHEDEERWAVLTAADLPFAFTDYDAALKCMHNTRIIIGSKAHADSQIEVDAQRRVASAAYKFARRAVLGMRVGDSQGSVFLRADLARVIVPRVKARGFFYSTELVYFAEREGERVIEVPVVLEKSERTSTVRPVKHGMTMLGQLVELRARTLFH